MQSSLYSPSETFFQHQIPWKTSTLLNPKPQSLFFKNPKPHNPKPSNSLKTSSSAFVSNRGGEEPPTLLNLPVAIHSRSGKVFRYLWDGTNLQLVNLNGVSSNWLTFNYKTAIWDFFIPRRVNENYLNYVKWKFFHRIFSSALQVLATQAMFRAMGVGYSRSLSSAAALNWVLKDGLGRFSRCVYTASLASAFDTNMKRVRFSTSVLFSLSIGVELLTPSFPQYFLLLASVANIAKQISLACYLATCVSHLKSLKFSIFSIA
ncbi:hypothetical protein GIB67_007395 [Kingdonia uniflora]|uniref:Protein root UVB sensitive/RUS domain-containing protein n=1 Tax=Kingdonia uniflora TaxID=39325 RepID=A0A7J7MLZ5_9MAGN|nr:hypothetical protein GIB67_007395 [Kingdonia uniflora]